MRALSTALVAIVLVAGCVPTDFDDLRRRASTVALAPPSDYPLRGFGEVVTGYSGEVRGVFGSRVAASAGEGSPYSVFPLLIGEQLRLDTPVMDGCDEEVPCRPGAGVSLVGLPRWGTRELCLVAAAPDSGEVVLRCEDDPTRLDLVTAPAGQGFGRAAIGLGEHRAGRALFGAPDAAGGDGAVYRLPDRGAPIELDLGTALDGSRGIGIALAAAPIDGDTLLVASAGAGRVIVSATFVDAGGSVTTHVRDCIDDASPGFGQALAVGDLNADGVPEVVIGSGAVEGRIDTVAVYDGADLPPEGTCDGSWAPAIELACPTIDGLDCAGAMFGRALAIGDVDGDGVGDLLIGAPMAAIDGVAGAGAALLFRGANSLVDLERTVVALTSSSPATDAHLGTSVATSPGAVVNTATGARRVEPIAGAPGVDRVYVFLCSGLSDDSPESLGDERCQP